MRYREYTPLPPVSQSSRLFPTALAVERAGPMAVPTPWHRGRRISRPICRRIGELFDSGFPFEIDAGEMYDSIPRLLGRATVDVTVRRDAEVNAERLIQCLGI